MPNASSGEFAHQRHKKATKNAGGSAGTMIIGGHFMRVANTNCAWHALANGIPYSVMRYNRSTKVREEVTVRPGDACIRAVRQLMRDQPGGLAGTTEISAAAEPSPAMKSGSYRGAAHWTVRLHPGGGGRARAASDGGGSKTGWRNAISVGRFRPDEKELLKAYKNYFGCGRKTGSSVFCRNRRCPRCWSNRGKLDTRTVECSRFDHTAPKKASSGSGRWKGGNAKAAGTSAPSMENEWDFGAYSGEDVEIHKGKPPYRDDPTVSSLTMVKIVCFFEHQANKRTDDPEYGAPMGVKTTFVLGFEYVGAGSGPERCTDVTTQHPIMLLRGRGRPLVWPVSAIRRHVHLYHLCPSQLNPVNEVGEAVDDRGKKIQGHIPTTRTPSDGICCISASSTGGGAVWRHKYRLANPSISSYDKYLLNEHHHSIFQDSFI